MEDLLVPGLFVFLTIVILIGLVYFWKSRHNELCINILNELNIDESILLGNDYFKKNQIVFFKLRELRNQNQKKIDFISEIAKKYDVELNNLTEFYIKRKIDEFDRYSKNLKHTILEIAKKLEIEEVDFTNQKLILRLDELFTNINLQNQYIDELEKCINVKDVFYNNLSHFNDENLNKIITLIGDFKFTEFEISEKYLRNKKRPAFEEAKRIGELKNESKAIFLEYRKMLYKYEFLIQTFPELQDYTESYDDLLELNKTQEFDDIIENFDRTNFYLTKEEFQNLDEIERNQLALDRYVKRKKTKWEIGKDYEMFCGYEYEKIGWDVEYFGIEKKLNDLGRDLIATKNEEVHIIQCKYWSNMKLIHEKHILQLFGTTKVFELNAKKTLKIVPVFITNIELSETALKFAKILNVKIIQKQLDDYPRIKCNINKNEMGEITKIYHLPFDQQYDKTKINSKNEFYTYTVKEAVEKGFRRAFRYNIQS